VRKRAGWAAVVAASVLALAGCGGSGGDSGSSGAAGDSSAAASPAADAVLATADSDLGTVVVDADGRTVYVFDKDTAGSGTSACSSADCLANWHAVTADSARPAVDGVSGKVATITRSDGAEQVTLDGLPLYTFAADSHAGDVRGEGVKGLWWAVAPDGAKITQPASSAPPTVTGY
jgi:predicted lipoprotein with Yx(FWY)xxD motif